MKAKEILRDELKNAGGNFDVIAFRNPNKFECIIKALEELKIFWCEVNGEILTNRHELYSAVLPTN